MSDMSNYSFTGRLVKDAEFKTIASGKSLLEANIAVNVGWGDYKCTNWIKVQQWGERGKSLAEWLVKGSTVAVSGELKIMSWEKDGKNGQDAIVNASSISLLQSKKQDAGSEPGNHPTSPGDDPVF